MTEFIEEYIKRTAGRMIKVINFEAQVVSVDKNKDTIVVQPVEGDEIPDVKLKSIISDNTKKIVPYPAVGSFVTVSLLRNSNIDFYVTGFSEVEELVINCDKVVINGGDKGGLVNWTDAKTQHDKTKAFLNAIKNACATPVNEPGNGAPSAFQIALNAAISTLQVPSFESLEDTKVKH
jgi:hypothetical protein